MVRTRITPQIQEIDTETLPQSTSQLGLLLAQAGIQDGTVVDKDTICLTCVRDLTSKYCYDSQTGAGVCCGMNDVSATGCNQAENSQIICSTDKIITKSSMYEVCPHNADQCDTKMLAVNNEMHGQILNTSSQVSTKTLLNQEEDLGWFGASVLFEGWSVGKTSDYAEFDGTNVGEDYIYEDESELTFKIDNEVAKASLIDDSYWRALDINSENGTVCSYQLLNEDSYTTNNVFELQLSGLANVEIGLYYGQYKSHLSDGETFDVSFESTETTDELTKQLDSYSRLIDMKIFGVNECNDLLHCTVSTTNLNDDDRYIQLMLSKAEFVNLNLLPIDETQPMTAKVNYRLINQQEHSFIVQTLIFMGVGFAMIFLFIGLLFRALNPKTRPPAADEV